MEAAVASQSLSTQFPPGLLYRLRVATTPAPDRQSRTPLFSLRPVVGVAQAYLSRVRQLLLSPARTREATSSVSNWQSAAAPGENAIPAKKPPRMVALIPLSPLAPAEPSTRARATS